MKAKEAENHRETSGTHFPEVPLMGREFHAGQQKKTNQKTNKKHKLKIQKSNEGGNSLQVSVEELPWGIGCPRFSVQNLSWALLSLLLFSSTEVGKQRLTQHSSPAAGGSAALCAQVVILKVSSGRIEKCQRNLHRTRHRIKRRWLR